MSSKDNGVRIIYGSGVVDLHYPKKIRRGSRQDVVVVWSCPYFERWRGLIRRCYSKAQLERNPTYLQCEVCDDWLIFSKFKLWMETQDWEGKELDKDLLVDNNKLYSPETCLWVSHDVNIFICDRRRLETNTKSIGTALDIGTGLWRAQCGNPFGNTSYEKRGYIGLFKTQELAHLAWKIKKHEYACRLAELQENPKVAEALLNRYKLY